MKLSREELIHSVKSQMPERRWQHVLGVMALSKQLAVQYGEDPERAELAAILHDVAKYWPTDRMETIIREQGLPELLLVNEKSLWHAPVGAWVAEHEYGISDPEVLDAIRYHTSGRVGMSKLEKIVCLADYIEPSRDFPGVEEIRELSGQDLDKALIAGLDTTIILLVKQGKAIFPMTVEARNDLLAKAAVR